MIRMRLLKILSGLVVITILFSDSPALRSPLPVAEAQIPIVNGVVGFFNVLGAARRRNRVYREARSTQQEMNEYYDTLIQEAKSQLQERQLMGAEAPGQFAEGMRSQRGQLRVYIKMREALLAEKTAATSQIEAEKNQARQQFNSQLLNQVVGLLIQSPGGQRLLGQIREAIGNLREVAEGIQAAIAGNRPFDALAEAFASHAGEIPFLQNAAYNLGHAVGHKVDQLLGGTISRLDTAMADFSGELSGALDQINQMDAELANYQQQERTPVSLIEEGGPLGSIRGVDRANAAIDVAAQAYTNAALLAGAVRGPVDEATRGSMRDRIRNQLLQNRLDRLSAVGQKMKHVVCTGVGQAQYILAMQQLGRTPEAPMDPESARYIVCTDRGSGVIVHAGLIGAAMTAQITPSPEALAADETPTATSTSTEPEEERCSLNGNGDFVIESYRLTSVNSSCDDPWYTEQNPADPLLMILAAYGAWEVTSEGPEGPTWTWQPSEDLQGSSVTGDASIEGTNLKISTSMVIPRSTSLIPPNQPYGNPFMLAIAFPLIPFAARISSQRKRRLALTLIALLSLLLMAQSCDFWGTVSGEYTLPIPENGFPCEIPEENPNLAELPGSSGSVTMELSSADDEGAVSTCTTTAQLTGLGVLKRDGFYTPENLNLSE